ncbi:serine hydrolase FSH [Aspergillus flavus]|uniref:Serine hydrolase FSH n=1 Tax=Aspergillus flavus (strain ATCC 200026 / FGSC A1120 / IAM 13836 / NRRL 3357 / JCM 12722 / SRRC 167) TaxID=332952 RepID=A0A7U2N0E1_ASPFN|nr:serine hydrolase FSH [Aspergillus flavus]
MNKSLPRIACFHGGGSSAAIYEIQCSFLTALLAHEFQFEFFEGPFDSIAGPGILPAFGGFEPYKSWFSKGESNGHNWTEQDSLEWVWTMMEERRAGQGGEWVGVMGFSEGTRIASGLLLDQQSREKLGLRPAVPSIQLRFGVLCMGGGPPMAAHFDYVSAGTTTNDQRVIRIPTLHMHGLRDKFLALGRDQYNTYFDPSRAFLFEVDYHHAMPWLEKESLALAQRIQSLHKKTQASR